MERSFCGKIFRALGDETRLKIFGMLCGGSLCACKILERLKISQPTLSHHMKILCESGLVVAERKWKWYYYSIDARALDAVLGFLRRGETENISEG